MRWGVQVWPMVSVCRSVLQREDHPSASQGTDNDNLDWIVNSAQLVTDLLVWLKLTKQSRRSLRDMSAMKMLGMRTWRPLPRDPWSTAGQRRRRLWEISLNKQSRPTSDRRTPNTTGENLLKFAQTFFFIIFSSVHLRNFVKSLGKVTLAGIKEAARTILPHFLSSETSQTVIVCPPSNLDDIVESFKENGLTLTQINSLVETFLAE